MRDDMEEFNYFKKRDPKFIYVSKSFPHIHFKGLMTDEKRFVRRVFEKENTNEFVKINGEIVLKEMQISQSKFQVCAIVYSKDDTNLMEFTIQKFVETQGVGLSPIEKLSISFSQKEFLELLQFLSDLKFLDYNNKERFIIKGDSIPRNKILLNISKPDNDKLLIDKELIDVVQQLSNLNENQREYLLAALKNNILSKRDLDILSGRRDGLDEFERNMENISELNEKEWQNFFERNSWIFGYGLDYKFLSILQREAHVSSVDMDGKNEVKTDFLLADNNFTVIVELKRPDTILFNQKNRSESWCLSNDLTYAVSQILTQKAEWEIKSETPQYDQNQNLIKQVTYDPKTILIIGHTKQFSGTKKDDVIKKKTFELYRRNSKNIEIFTYDELLDRARFIVNDKTEKVDKNGNSNGSESNPSL